MKHAVIDNRLPEYTHSLYRNLDISLREASRDILIKAKTRAPYSGTVTMRKSAGRSSRRGTGGHLRADTETKRVKNLHHRVSFFKEYAGAQEKGRAGNKVFRHYTTAGTGAHYLEESGDEIMSKMLHIIRKYARLTR